jgi:hypothetical protein
VCRVCVVRGWVALRGRCGRPVGCRGCWGPGAGVGVFVISAGGLLSGHAHFLDWWVIQISLANLIVIVIMVVLFVLAVVVPFPHARDSVEDREPVDVGR